MAGARTAAWPLIAHLGARVSAGPNQPGGLWSGTLPGGLFRSDDHGAELGAGPRAVGPSGAPNWFGGGADAPRHPLHLRRSARLEDGAASAVSSGGVWHTTDDGGDVGAARRRACSPSTCRPSRCTTRHPGRAPGPVPVPARPPVDSAPQRHLPLDRRGADWQRHRRRPGRRCSGSPWPSIRTTRTPRGSCRRSRTRSGSRSTASWW